MTADRNELDPPPPSSPDDAGAAAEPARGGRKRRALTRDMILNLPDRPSVVVDDVPRIGRVEIRDINVGTSSEIRKVVAASETPAKTYAEELARHAIRVPSLTASEVSALPDSAWEVLAAAPAEATEIDEWFEALQQESDPQVRLYRADQDRWKQWTQELRLSIQPTLDGFAER